MSLKSLRALIGNEVRLGVDVDDRGTCEDDARCVVYARWSCGCTAEGESFNQLTCAMCNEHRVIASAA